MRRNSGGRGLVLILFGSFTALIFLPFAKGASQRGVLESLNRMFVPLLERKENPVFSVVEKGKEDHTAQEVEYGNSGLVLEFEPELSKDEMERAIAARFQTTSATPAPGRLRFHGWAVDREAVQLPYRWVLAASLLFAFVGSVWVVRAVAARD